MSKKNTYVNNTVAIATIDRELEKSLAYWTLVEQRWLLVITHLFHKAYGKQAKDETFDSHMANPITITIDDFNEVCKNLPDSKAHIGNWYKLLKSLDTLPDKVFQYYTLKPGAKKGSKKKSDYIANTAAPIYHVKREKYKDTAVVYLDHDFQELLLFRSGYTTINSEITFLSPKLARRDLLMLFVIYRRLKAALTGKNKRNYIIIDKIYVASYLQVMPYNFTKEIMRLATYYINVVKIEEENRDQFRFTLKPGVKLWK